MRGASQILLEATNATFVCSGAIRTPEFWEAVAASEGQREQSLWEFAQVLRILEERSPDPPESVAPRWAEEGTVLLERSGPARPSVHIRAISPSPGARRLGLHELARMLPEPRMPKRRAVSLGANQQSVAMWVEVGAVRAVLGGDLENSPSETIGWRAVLSSPVLPPGRAGLFKVPHHGSDNAHSDELWEVKLTDSATAVLSAYASKSKPVPTDAAIRRIKERASQAFCTSNPRGSKFRSGNRVVDRKVRERTREARTVVGRVGHVRVRCSTRNELENASVELFGGAFQL